MLASLLGLMSITLFGAHIYDLHQQRIAVLVRIGKGLKIDEDRSRRQGAA